MPEAFRLPCSVKLEVGVDAELLPRGMVMPVNCPGMMEPLESEAKPCTNAPVLVTSRFCESSVKAPSRVYCWPAALLVTKNPDPSMAISVGTPVGWIEPGVKFCSMLATDAPSPCWLGLEPPVSVVAGVPEASVT